MQRDTIVEQIELVLGSSSSLKRWDVTYNGEN